MEHTALAARDLPSSIAFYTQNLGFRVGQRFLNRGVEQDRLDGLANVEVDIILETGEAEPHLELLHYRNPCEQGATGFC